MDQTQEVEIPTKEPNLDEILQKMDEALDWGPGPKPSEIWRYREEVRVKYGLPDSGLMRSNPLEYMRQTEQLLAEEGVVIRSKHEFERFFKENPEAQGVNFRASVFRDTTVSIKNAPDDDINQLIDRAKHMGHEAVHALQTKRAPRMPTEEMEREAYYYELITPALILLLKDKPGDLYDYIHHMDGIEDRIKLSTQVDNRLDPRTPSKI